MKKRDFVIQNNYIFKYEKKKIKIFDLKEEYIYMNWLFKRKFFFIKF